MYHFLGLDFPSEDFQMIRSIMIRLMMIVLVLVTLGVSGCSMNKGHGHQSNRCGCSDCANKGMSCKDCASCSSGAEKGCGGGKMSEGKGCSCGDGSCGSK